MDEVERVLINAGVVIKSFDGTDKQKFLKQFVEGLIRIDGLIKGRPDEEQIRERFFEGCELLDQSPLHQRMRHKPLGLSGDYLLLDWIYTKRIAGNGLGKIWDTLFHDYPGAIAVRNRNTIFQKYMEEVGASHSKVSILDLACGSCRYILEIMSEAENKGALEFLQDITFVDSQAEALEFAKVLYGQMPFKVQPQWVNSDILRFRPHQKYNFIWSSGLFDYLTDDQAVFFIKRMYGWLDNNGLIVFGNFHPAQPTRIPMELVGNWFLIHRTDQDLVRLVAKAAITPSKVKVSQEPMGINLFCEIRK